MPLEKGGQYSSEEMQRVHHEMFVRRGFEVLDENQRVVKHKAMFDSSGNEARSPFTTWKKTDKNGIVRTIIYVAPARDTAAEATQETVGTISLMATLVELGKTKKENPEFFKNCEIFIPVAETQNRAHWVTLHIVFGNSSAQHSAKIYDSKPALGFGLFPYSIDHIKEEIAGNLKILEGNIEGFHLNQQGLLDNVICGLCTSENLDAILLKGSPDMDLHRSVEDARADHVALYKQYCKKYFKAAPTAKNKDLSDSDEFDVLEDERSEQKTSFLDLESDDENDADDQNGNLEKSGVVTFDEAFSDRITRPMNDYTPASPSEGNSSVESKGEGMNTSPNTEAADESEPGNRVDVDHQPSPVPLSENRGERTPEVVESPEQEDDSLTLILASLPAPGMNASTPVIESDESHPLASSLELASFENTFSNPEPQDGVHSSGLLTDTNQTLAIEGEHQHPLVSSLEMFSDDVEETPAVIVQQPQVEDNSTAVEEENVAPGNMESKYEEPHVNPQQLILNTLRRPELSIPPPPEGVSVPTSMDDHQSDAGSEVSSQADGSEDEHPQASANGSSLVEIADVLQSEDERLLNQEWDSLQQPGSEKKGFCTRLAECLWAIISCPFRWLCCCFCRDEAPVNASVPMKQVQARQATFATAGMNEEESGSVFVVPVSGNEFDSTNNTGFSF